MKIDIGHISKLSRLKISDEKAEKFAKDMEDIVLMVENLPEITDETITLDKSNQMQLRKDEVKPSLRREEIVKNAPSTEAGCFVVPRVLD